MDAFDRPTLFATTPLLPRARNDRALSFDAFVRRARDEHGVRDADALLRAAYDDVAVDERHLVSAYDLALRHAADGVRLRARTPRPSTVPPAPLPRTMPDARMGHDGHDDA